MLLHNFIGIYFVIMNIYCDNSVDKNDVILAKCHSQCLKLFEDSEIRNEKTIKQLLKDLQLSSASSFNKQNITRHYPSVIKKLSDNMSVFVTTKLNKMNDRIQAESVKFLRNNQLHFYRHLITCLLNTNNTCISECIKQCHNIPIDPQIKKLKNSDGLIIITKPHKCNSCFLNNNYGCLMACTFLNQYAIEETKRIQKCPVLKPSKKCPKRCEHNGECGMRQQCCFLDGCGQICQNLTADAFPTYRLKPNKGSNASMIEFDWSKTYQNYTSKANPIIFILQVQSCFCKKFNNKFVKQWKTLSITHKGGAKLTAFNNGTLYRFRLAAISLLTRRANQKYGLVSEDLPSILYPPKPPAKPQMFRDTTWRSSSYYGNFNVMLKWVDGRGSKNKHERIQVENRFDSNIEYKITWAVDHISDEYSGETISALTEYMKIVKGNTKQCEIQDLKPGTTYKFSAYTKLYWPGHGYILSAPAVLFLTTPNINNNEQMVKWSPENLNSDAESDNCMCKLKNAEFIKQEDIVKKNDNIQVLIDMGQYGDYIAQLQAEVCINVVSSQKPRNNEQNLKYFRKIYLKTRKIFLKGLEPHCRYSVTITTRKDHFNSFDVPKKQFCFCTHHCRFADKPSICFKERETPNKPLAPSDLMYNLSNSDTLTYSISWKKPYYTSSFSSSHNPPKPTKYRIVWGPRQNEPISLILYQNNLFKPIIQVGKQFVKILSFNTTQYQLKNLTQDTVYIVQIQSIYQDKNGGYIESKPSFLYLPTRGYKDIQYSVNSRAQNSMINSFKLHVLSMIFVYYLAS